MSPLEQFLQTALLTGKDSAKQMSVVYRKFASPVPKEVADELTDANTQKFAGFK
jgi:hypothetical protein